MNDDHSLTGRNSCSHEGDAHMSTSTQCGQLQSVVVCVCGGVSQRLPGDTWPSLGAQGGFRLPGGGATCPGWILELVGVCHRKRLLD